MVESIVRSIYGDKLWVKGKPQRVYERIEELGYLHEVYVGPLQIKDNPDSNGMTEWCEENNISAITTSIYFHFLTENDAMAFKLRWTQ